jgi:hypothetical protein
MATALIPALGGGEGTDRAQSVLKARYPGGAG